MKTFRTVSCILPSSVTIQCVLDFTLQKNKTNNNTLTNIFVDLKTLLNRSLKVV